MSLSGKQIKNTYKDILTVNSGTDNQGLESSLKTVADGEGVASAIQLSTSTLKIPAGKALDVRQGSFRLPTKTTTELNTLTGGAGDIVFDSAIGVFKVWRP